MPTVAVIGAGLAGLVAAYDLSKRGLDVTVFEASDRTGGVIRSARKNGYLVEYGPNTIQDRSGVLADLIDELKLDSELLEASHAARKRYIVRNGKLVAVPSNPPALLTTGLFSASAKLRLLQEPFLKSVPLSDEESIADFVRRRLGQEILDYAVNPFIAGIYAGDPEELSIEHTFPSLFELEHEYGSIIGGQIQHMRKRRSESVKPKRKRRMFSFRDGLKVLPDTLSSWLGNKVRLNSPVMAINSGDGRWSLTVVRRGVEEQHVADAVLFTAPLHRLSDIEVETWMDLSPLREVVYAPVCVVAVGYPAKSVSHSLDGFGMLVPEREKDFQILGALFSSTLFADRAPRGHVLLTTFIGGQRYPYLTRLSDESLIRTSHTDLERLLGIRSDPSFTHIVRWEHAIPQYRKGYGTVKQTIERLEQEHRGLYLAGNFRSGISIADTAATALAVSQRIAERFA